MDWIDRALFSVLWVAEKLRAVLIGQAYLFLLMGYDTSELCVWRNEQGNMEVVPRSVVSE